MHGLARVRDLAGIQLYAHLCSKFGLQPPWLDSYNRVWYKEVPYTSALAGVADGAMYL